MFLHPAQQALFKPTKPWARMTDLVSSTTDTGASGTPYTFTGVNIPTFGPNYMRSMTTADWDVQSRSPSNCLIYAIIHGEDALATYTVSSISIGGVNGTSVIDRGGSGSTISSAIFVWSNTSLAGITNTDVVLTWSENITGCAVGIVGVWNVPHTPTTSGTNSASGTGALALAPNIGSTAFPQANMYVLTGSTCSTGGGTESPDCSIATASALNPPELLYAGFNAEIDFAAWFMTCPQYNADISAAAFGHTVNWSGTGNGDAVSISCR